MYKLNKQGDNIQHWRTPFPILNQSLVPCLVLTVASWTCIQISQEVGKVVWYFHLYACLIFIRKHNLGIRYVMYSLWVDWDSICFKETMVYFNEIGPVSMRYRHFVMDFDIAGEGKERWSRGHSVCILLWPQPWNSMDQCHWPSSLHNTHSDVHPRGQKNKPSLAGVGSVAEDTSFSPSLTTESGTWQ